jgi:transposase
MQGASILGRCSKKSGPQAIGVSRGGLNTKIHVVCDALGNPLRFKLTAGNISDTGELLELIAELSCEELLADKAYDSNNIVEMAQANEIEVVIPPKINRKIKRSFDSIKYRSRHLIENLFQRMKVYRRIATRYDKLDAKFMGFICLVGAMKWLH